MTDRSPSSDRHRTLVAIGAAILAIGGIALSERILAVATRLAECLIVFGLVAVLAWSTRGFVRNVLIVCGSFALGLAVLEGVALVLLSPGAAGAAAASDDSGLARSRPLLGWGPTKPGVYHTTKHTASGRTIFDSHVTIDENLDRKTLSASGPRPIAFFGDSWIYGDGLDDDGALPQVFADLTDRKLPVLNLAFAGWSPAQNLLALQNGLYAPLLRSPRHFILFTSPFHLERIACKGAYATSQAPRFELVGSALEFAGPCSGRFSLLAPLERFARRFALYEMIEPRLEQPNRRDVEIYLKILETFVATAKAKYDVPTTILFAPFSANYLKGTGYTEAEIVAALRKSGIDVLVDKLPPIADPSLYSIADDGHPTKLANQARARAIAAHLHDVDAAALKAVGE